MKASIFSPFRPNWKSENRTLSPSERKYLWRIDRDQLNGTHRSNWNIGTKLSPGLRNKALQKLVIECAMEFVEAGRKPHNLCAMVARKMDLTTTRTRKYLGSFIAEMKEARDAN